MHDQLFKLHLVQALGPLREQRKNREDTDQRFHRIRTPMGSKLETVPNWNIRPATSESSGAAPGPETVQATLAPAPYFSRITKPSVIVMNRSKHSLCEKSDRLRRIRQAACGEGAIPGWLAILPESRGKRSPLKGEASLPHRWGVRRRASV